MMLGARYVRRISAVRRPLLLVMLDVISLRVSVVSDNILSRTEKASCNT